MIHRSIFLLLCTTLLLLSCGDSDPLTLSPTGGDPDRTEWLVPQNEVFDGGPGLDGIPSVDDPDFTLANDVNYLNNDDLVLVFANGPEIKVYPHPILDWHEIVNDDIAGLKLAISYCPLTGTGVGWNRVIDGEETTFGVSGLLYNTNLMPYDRRTFSTWSQQRLDCVNGELIGQKAETYSLVEMDFGTLLAAFPEAQVLNLNTGFNRRYGVYPYNDYRTNNNSFLFPISVNDNRLQAKERTLGVLDVNGRNKVYSFNRENDQLEGIEDNVGGQDLFVVRSTDLNFIVAFNDDLGLSLVENQFPAIVQDSDGTRYDVLGRAIGELKPNLEMPTQFIGYWFSWGTFYPDIELF